MVAHSPGQCEAQVQYLVGLQLYHWCGGSGVVFARPTLICTLCFYLSGPLETSPSIPGQLESNFTSIPEPDEDLVLSRGQLPASQLVG